jgi:O-antigen ligase
MNERHDRARPRVSGQAAGAGAAGRIAVSDKNLKLGRALTSSRDPSKSALFLPILVLLMISLSLGHSRDDQGLDLELAIRLAGYALAAAIGLYALGRGKIRLNFGILAWAAVAAFICVTSLYSPDGTFSFIAGLAHFSLLLFVWWVANRFGQARTAFMIALAGLIIGALSIGAYYLFPDQGRSIADSYIADPGGRMRGVVSQPNTLGSISAITILCATIFFKGFTRNQRVFAALAIGTAAFCLYFSESRTSLAALLLCLVLWGLYRTNAAINLFAIIAVALGACLIIGFVPDISAYLMRAEAGPDDLASLNGRARIWAVVWEFIHAHPIIGQGYGASRLILPNDDRLFTAALNSHNLYLELLFSGGIVMLGLFAVAMLITVYKSVIRRRVEALIFVLYFLIVGAAESSPYGALPLFSVVAFYSAVSLCLVRTTPRPRIRLRKQPVPPSRMSGPVSNPSASFARQWK